ncbi:MAG: carboxypeptidase regulatory-like domain-containing protein [Terriglobia bacterium]
MVHRGPALSALFYALALLTCAQAATQVTIAGKVIDENGAPVKGAHIVILAAGVLKAPPGGGVTSDATGLFHLEIPAEGIYQVRADCEGYFEFRHQSVNLDPDSPLEIQMNHLKELAESVDVRYSAPAIDPEQTSDSKRLHAPDLLNVPYPASQDYRSALPMLSGAIQDNSGQTHFNGGRTNETNYRLNGFDVADPATGNLTTRLNVDTVQTLELQASRFSPEKGKGSAGTLDIRTQMGDDHWRFGGTNFFPGIGMQGGIYLNHWSPRVIVSGPLKKGRGWIHNAFDTFYSASTVSDLPTGQNRTSSISGSNLTRLQWNLRDNQILTGSLLVNREDSTRNGLSFLNPAETTVNRRRSLLFGTIKDQWIVGGGLLEFGFADTRAYFRGSPQGDVPYVITPFGAAGNYFRDDNSTSNRQEWLLNGFVKPLTWHGAHQIEAGVNVEHSDIYQTIFRHDLQVVRSDQSVVRDVQFLGSPLQFRNNIETYGYALDRWRPRTDLTIEVGFRTQWDEYTGGAPPAPRIAASWVPSRFGLTKFSAGWGIFYDAVTLGMLALGQEQTSVSTFYSPNGTATGVPVESRFILKPQDLRLPRYAITSFSAERQLPWNLFGRVSLTSREGSRGFSFAQMAVNPATNLYVLDNIERQRYRAAEFTLRRTFLAKYQWFASYTRSEARSNAVLTYSIENPVLTPQSGGPLPWDAPNRFLTWGWAPLTKTWFPHLLQPVIGDTDFQFLADYRTGLPFSAVNEVGYVVGRPNGYRFPDFLTLNVALERRFRFRGYLWAWRVGLINALGRQNPNVVNTDFDSPEFRAFGRGQARAVNVRLRFVGRK